MKITKYVQSCVLIELDGKNILIDPGKYCYKENFKPENWENIDVLLLTHGHSDHCLPEAVEIIYQNNKPIIIGSKWVADIFEGKQIPIEVLEPNQEKKINNITVKAIKTIHGEHPKMSEAPKETVGFLIQGTQSVYHCSDTLYFKEKPYADVVLVSISNDYVTMGPKEAAIFIKDIKPKLAIPIHYESPQHPMDPNEFIKQMHGSGIEVRVLNNRESFEF